MSISRRTFLLAALALAVSWLGAWLVGWPDSTLSRAELFARDQIARYGRFVPANPKLHFLAIDNDSITLDAETDLKEFFGITDENSAEARALRLMSVQWPWPRSVYACILDRLVAAGARVVVFDLNFPTPSEHDAEFRAALDRHRGRVVIGSNVVFSEQSAAHTLPSPTLIPQTGRPDPRVGFVNFWSHSDEIVREARFNGSDLDGETYRSLAAQAVRQMGRPELVPADTETRALRLTNLPGKGFAPHSIFEIFVPEYWERNYRGGAVFQDSIVVVGAAGNWNHDEHLTSLGMMPGPELQLNAINALLHGAFIGIAAPATRTALIFLAGALAFIFAIRCASPILRLLGLVGASAGWIAATVLLHDRADLAIPLATPLIVLNGLGVFSLFHDLLATRSERRRLRSTLERYVSKNVVRHIMERPEAWMQSLGGATVPATILFSDIRSFTRLCANTAPQDLVAQLNEYLTVMVECVFRHGGTLDKFIGDAVMAVWGNARTEGPAGDARNAVACALAMREELAQLNARWVSEGRLPVAIGIALNHGEVVAGNVGSPSRMEFTVIGDAVNVCWRLQERTKEHRCDLILGESVEELLGAEYKVEPLGSILVGETVWTQYGRLAEEIVNEELTNNEVPAAQVG